MRRPVDKEVADIFQKVIIQLPQLTAEEFKSAVKLLQSPDEESVLLGEEIIFNSNWFKLTKTLRLLSSKILRSHLTEMSIWANNLFDPIENEYDNEMYKILEDENIWTQ